MNIIILSGGSGRRLWPLSNEVRSKQFLKIFRRDDGTKESMAMRMYRMIKAVDNSARITIATSEDQVPQIQSQLSDTVSISVEPTRRDTFPAIALAAAFLKQQGVNENDSVVVCPVDPYVEQDYFECLKELSNEAGKAHLTLMGIEPTYPSEKYGYIIPSSKEHITSLKEFREKPDKETAKKYIEQGALWNGGVFAFKLSYILSVIESSFGTSDYKILTKNYAALPKVSFDYAVVEKEESINVVRFSGAWKDLGTWNTLSEAMDEAFSGNVVSHGCMNTHVINELGIPLIALGVKDCIIAATPDGILVSDKNESPAVKAFVPDSRPMYERRSWGEYKVLQSTVHEDYNESLIKEVILNSGEQISFQGHKHRTEIWVFIKGEGDLVLNSHKKIVRRGDVEIVKPGIKHALRAKKTLCFIEIQVGEDLTEEDIEGSELDWE